MVVQNPYAMLLSKELKNSFGVDCLLRSETSHQMDVLQMGVMVSEDRGSRVPLLGK